MIAATARNNRNRTALFSAMATALVLSGCTQPKPPPPLENIPVPLPENIPQIPQAPTLPAERVPPELVTASRGEDLWHLRSALNVAALICSNAEFPNLIPNYNRLLTTHKTLLSAAVQSELDQFKAKDKRKWQAMYDTHMTQLYNEYSLTSSRGRFCEKSAETADTAADMTDESLSAQATAMIFRLNLAAQIY